MDVILREDIAKLGRTGEVVRVKDGYARNYLLPRGLAYHATEGNRRRLQVEATQSLVKAAGERSSAEEFARQIEAQSLTFTAKAGEGDKLFGSITAGDIGEKLAELGFTIDKRVIELEEPLKLIGVYTVPVRVHQEVKAQLRVWVVKE